MSHAPRARPSIPVPVPDIEAAARAHQNRLTKPASSLGRLEELAIQIAAFQGAEQPAARPCAVLIFAADHPVTRHGVSPYPASVTRAMLENFLRGGAAASVLARLHAIPMHVVDVGVEPGDEAGSGAELGLAGTLHRLVPPPAGGDIRHEDALCPSDFERCMRAGEAAVHAAGPGLKLLLLGEMGIGNSTVSAAVAAKLLGASDPADLVGAGTGATGALLEMKKQVVRDAVARLPETCSPLELFRRLGGRELAAAYGAMRAALCERTVVLVDGFMSGVVAAVLIAEEPDARPGLVFTHRSREAGHGALLEHLKVTPLLDLGLCLGEGTGALSAFPLVEAACALHAGMATFEAANVPGILPR